MSDVQLGPIGQVSLNVTDLDRSTAFYRDTLGLPLLYAFEGLAFFDCGGTRLFLSVHPPVKGSVIYFSVPDIDAAYDTLRSRGVAFQGAPHLIHRHDDGTEEWMAFFTDPDENLLALMSQVAPA